MFNAYDFIYDGKSSISENVKILYTENNPFEFVKSIPDKSISKFKTNQSSKWRISGVAIQEPLSFDIQIMIYNEDIVNDNQFIKRNLISKISHWLFDSTNFKKLQILSDEMRDLYFMAIFTNIEYFEAGGDISGFRATVLCDTIGAYEDKVITKKCTGVTGINLQCLQDGAYEVTPTYTIKANETSISIMVNDKTIDLLNITAGSIITIDTDTLMAYSNKDNLYRGDKFNNVFPRFKYGKNEITVLGNCDLTIRYSLIREVGA